MSHGATDEVGYTAAVDPVPEGTPSALAQALDFARCRQKGEGNDGAGTGTMELILDKKEGAITGKVSAGNMTDQELTEIEQNACPTCGSCSTPCRCTCGGSLAMCSRWIAHRRDRLARALFDRLAARMALIGWLAAFLYDATTPGGDPAERAQLPHDVRRGDDDVHACIDCATGLLDGLLRPVADGS